MYPLTNPTAAINATVQPGTTIFEPTGTTIKMHDDGYYLINPGSVGQPRSKDTRASYMVVDLAERAVTVHRVVYDAEATLAATRQAGLAPRLSLISGPLRGAIGGGLRALHLDRPVRDLATYLGL